MEKGRTSIVSLLALLLATVSAGPQTAGSAQTPSTKESFLQKVLRISGISASPATLRGPGDEVERGTLWVTDLQSGSRHQLSGDGYRSPIFLPGSKDVLALKGTELVRMPSSGGDARKLYVLPGITKLIGFSMDDPDLILAIAEGLNKVEVKLLSLSTGKTTTLSYDPASADDRNMIEQLLGWDRTYGDKTVFIKRMSKEGLGGSEEWTDVFLKVGNEAPVSISKCNGANCGQPALSSDGKWLAFVRQD